MPPAIRTRSGRSRTRSWPAWLCALFWLSAALGDEPSAPAISAATLQEKVSEGGRFVESFQVEGVICALLPKHQWIVVQDASGAVLLEAPALDSSLRVGDRVTVVGRHCAVDRGRMAIQLGTAPTVDLDGVHGAANRAGRVYLTSGLQPIHLSWFNKFGESALKLEYEGPGLSRQPVPDTMLYRISANAREIRDRGLDFSAYLGSGWTSVMDFERSTPVKHGVAHNFDRSYSLRRENAGLVFDGYIDVPETGAYTFYLESDDGARVHVGDPKASCAILRLGESSKPQAKPLDESFFAQNHSEWVQADGTVIFAAEDAGEMKMDVDWQGELLHVTVIDGASLFPHSLVRKRVKLAGLCEAASNVGFRQMYRLTIPSAENVEVSETSADARQASQGKVFDTVEQVRNLDPKEADRGLQAKIAGVVTWTSAYSLMLQDSTGGVFVISKQDPGPPVVGDLWEIEGCTERGGFAPSIMASQMRFLGHASQPVPVRATWDQLMNGSLDMQYVEIHGVLTAASDKELTILTQGGSIKIRDSVYYPLPSLLAPADRAARWLGSVLRIRGALSVQIDGQTRRAVPGVIRLGSPLVSIEEPPSSEPFAIPAKRAADLLLFDPRASAIQRTKLAGQIIYSRPGESFMVDGKTGVRLSASQTFPLGDLVEAVGFPQLGGPRLILQEAEIRVTGKAKFPEPAAIAPDKLLDRALDATLVQVEATLLEDSAFQDERVLEVQAGPYRFAARIESAQGPWKSLLPGSRLRLTGVYSWQPEERNPEAPEGFELLLRDRDAIRVLQAGSWWTERRVGAAAAALIGSLGVAAIWIVLLRKEVEERTRQWRKEISERQLAEQRRAVAQERARVAQDLHDELGAGLTEMGILGSLAKNAAVPAAEKEGYLDRLTESASALVTGLDEIVWAINPQYDSLGSLATYYSFFAERFLSPAGIVCHLQAADSFPDFPLDSNTRHSIFLAFKEALNNIVRHSGATEVQLEIELVDDELAITVRDNGRGFSPFAKAPGRDGIAGMRRRLRQMGGSCHVASEPGRGAAVEFRLCLDAICHDQNCHR